MPKRGADDQPHQRATGGPADEITFRTPARKRGTSRRPVARRRDGEQSTSCTQARQAGGGPADEITFRTPATPMPKLGADRRPVARRRNGEPSTSRTRARSRGGPADEITFRTPTTADADRVDQPHAGAVMRRTNHTQARRRADDRLHAGATSSSRPAARARGHAADQPTKLLSEHLRRNAERVDQPHAGATQTESTNHTRTRSRGGPADEITFRTPAPKRRPSRPAARRRDVKQSAGCTRATAERRTNRRNYFPNAH